jgi:hypothetical protein
MIARQVTAVDARIENVVKTIVRAAFFGYTPAYSSATSRRDPSGWTGCRRMWFST